MFFILSKFFYFFIQPFSWLLVLVFIHFFTKNEKWKKRSKWSIIALLLIFSNTFIFKEFEQLWEVHGTKIKDVHATYDAGIVLSGMFDYDNGLERLSVRRGTDRIWNAIDLYYAGKIKKIIITGGSGYVSDRGLCEAKQLKPILIKRGIPASDIIIETKSRNTYENATCTKEVLSRSYPHLKKFLLITSGQHMRRSREIFIKQGFKFDTFSTDLYTGKKRHYYWDQYFVPDIETFFNWNGLIKEWVGYVSYAIMGYL